MAQHISGPTIRPIQLRPQHRTQIPHANLQRIRRRALRLATDVDGRPAQDERDRGIDAAGCEESAEVRDAGAGARVFVCEKNNVSDYGEGGRGQDECGAASKALRENCDSDGEERGKGVGRDGQELRVGRGVAHVFDYCGLGER